MRGRDKSRVYFQNIPKHRAQRVRKFQMAVSDLRLFCCHRGFFSDRLRVMKHLQGWLGLQLDEVGFREQVLASLGGLITISLVWIVCSSALGKTDQLVLMPSMGATAVLLFAVPHGPLSQPWPVIGGHVVSAFLGVCCMKITSITPMAAGLAVGSSIAAMHFSSASTRQVELPLLLR
jgi:hypothetical protein